MLLGAGLTGSGLAGSGSLSARASSGIGFGSSVPFSKSSRSSGKSAGEGLATVFAGADRGMAGSSIDERMSSRSSSTGLGAALEAFWGSPGFSFRLVKRSSRAESRSSLFWAFFAGFGSGSSSRASRSSAKLACLGVALFFGLPLPLVIKSSTALSSGVGASEGESGWGGMSSDSSKSSMPPILDISRFSLASTFPDALLGATSPASMSASRASISSSS